EHEGSHCADQPHPQLHRVLGVGAQMMMGQPGTDKHTEQRAAKDAPEDDQANEESVHIRSSRLCTLRSEPSPSSAARARHSTGSIHATGRPEEYVNHLVAADDPDELA